MRATLPSFFAALVAAWASSVAGQPTQPFGVEETSIADVHDAIRSGNTTCAEVVQSYIERARAYNGVCTTLVTENGAAVPRAPRRDARRGAAAVSDADDRDHGPVPGVRELQRQTSRFRPDGSDGIGPDGAAAIRHRRRHAELAAGQRARDVEHPR